MLAVIGLMYLSVGCVSNPTQYDSNTAETALTTPRYYSNYHDLFKYIAQNELIPSGVASVDESSILKIAADSEVEVCRPQDYTSTLYVITPRYFLSYGAGFRIYDAIRGEQGNGIYYIVSVSTNRLTSTNIYSFSFELVGIATGNTYQWKNVANNVSQFITYWHTSASESPEGIYGWDGKVFGLVKTKLPNYK
jgi:hypothetical protein